MAGIDMTPSAFNPVDPIIVEAMAVLAGKRAVTVPDRLKKAAEIADNVGLGGFRTRRRSIERWSRAGSTPSAQSPIMTGNSRRLSQVITPAATLTLVDQRRVPEFVGTIPPAAAGKAILLRARQAEAWFRLHCLRQVRGGSRRAYTRCPQALPIRGREPGIAAVTAGRGWRLETEALT